MSESTYAIRISAQAYYALDAHMIFLAQVSPKAAEREKSRLLSKISSLSDNPYRHPVFDADTDIPEYRKMVISRYIILYLVDETNHTVSVDLVWDSRMDNVL
jgi:plasmid stabilization system protein ParE